MMTMTRRFTCFKQHYTNDYNEEQHVTDTDNTNKLQTHSSQQHKPQQPQPPQLQHQPVQSLVQQPQP